MSLLINGGPKVDAIVPPVSSSSTGKDPLNKFSPDLVREIFSYLPLADLEKCKKVSKHWKTCPSQALLRNKAFARMFAFGKEKWEKHFGDVGEEPPLSKNLEEILKSPNPIDPVSNHRRLYVLRPRRQPREFRSRFTGRRRCRCAQVISR